MGIKLYFVAVILMVTGAAQCNPENHAAGVTLGAIYNLQGEQSGLDLPSAYGAQLAVKLINQQGGVLGRPLTLVLLDGQSNLKEIGDKTRALLNKNAGLSAVLGLSDTDMVLAAAPPVAASHKVFMTSGATSPKLPKQIPDYLFLACFGDNVQAAAGAQWAWNKLGARSAVVLFDSRYAYTRLLQDYFRQSFQHLGGKIYTLRGYDEKHIEQAIKHLPAADLIYIAAEPPATAAKLVTALRRAGYGIPIMGGDGLDDAAVWSDLPALDQVYYTTHAYMGEDNQAPDVVAFRKAYQSAYPGETVNDFSALGYDAVNLLVAAIRKAESPDPGKVRDALGNIRNFQGVTGRMVYPEGGKIPTKTVSIINISQGQKHLASELVPDWVPAP